MQIRIEKRDSVSIREWEQFLATARRAGATDKTMVEDEVSEIDSDRLIGFKIDMDRASESEGPDLVSVPTDVIHDLLYVARTVANGDGDVRGLEPVARKALDDFSEHFLTPVIGADPWAEAAREREEDLAPASRGNRQES